MNDDDIWRGRTDDESPERNPVNALPDPLPDNPIARLWIGGYSLPLAYWSWYWGGSFAWRLVGILLRPPASSPAPPVTLTLIWLIACLSYMTVAAVGVWRSAGRYPGRPAWATLARVAVAAGVSLLVMQIIFVLGA